MTRGTGEKVGGGILPLGIKVDVKNKREEGRSSAKKLQSFNRGYLHIR